VREAARARAPDRHAPVVLAYRALGLGDLLTGLPALRALSDAFPGHRRVLATPTWLAPLARLSGSVDSVVDCAPLQPLPGWLAPPDVAANLHGRGPQSHRVVLAARPRRTIAFACAGIEATTRGPRWRADEHEVVRWCRLLEESGIPADPSRLGLAAPDLPVDPALRDATIVHPGAGAPARRWPLARWAEIARRETACGRHVVITGSGRERDLAAEVARRAGLGTEVVLAGATDVMQLAALVAAGGRIVCGDTGVAHLATALGTPSVVLFGPTPPRWWGPPADRPQHVVLWSGRTGDPHGPCPDAGLLAIGVEEVAAALDALAHRMPIAARG
jgi:ADP-heptose:LPS heptosyltransferase